MIAYPVQRRYQVVFYLWENWETFLLTRTSSNISVQLSNTPCDKSSCPWAFVQLNLTWKADKAMRQHSAQHSAPARKEIIFAARHSAYSANHPRLPGVNTDTCRAASFHRGIWRPPRRTWWSLRSNDTMNSQFARWHLNDGRDFNRRRDIESFNITHVKDTRQWRFDLSNENRWMLLIGVVERHCLDRRKAERSGQLIINPCIFAFA